MQLHVCPEVLVGQRGERVAHELAQTLAQGFGPQPCRQSHMLAHRYLPPATPQGWDRDRLAMSIFLTSIVPECMARSLR